MSPEGFRDEPEFVSTEEEVFLLDGIRSLEFHEVRMRGLAANRRVIQYGWEYSCCSQNAASPA